MPHEPKAEEQSGKCCLTCRFTGDLCQDPTQVVLKFQTGVTSTLPGDQHLTCQLGASGGTTHAATMLQLTPAELHHSSEQKLPVLLSLCMCRGQVRFYKKGPKACTVKLTITYEVPGPLTPFASVSLCSEGSLACA